jgi:hypothetical protein
MPARSAAWTIRTTASRRSPAHTSAMEGLIDRETSQEHHQNRIGHVASDSSRRVGVSNRARRERVIAHDHARGANHISTGGSAHFIALRTAAEPAIQCRLTGIESGEIVPSGQFLGRPNLAGAAHRSQGAFV